MSFDLHKYFQELMKDKADAMSGYVIEDGEQEWRTYIQVDYFCKANLDRPYTGPEQGIRPLSDFRRYNVVELEGLKRTLSESRFRYHLGRALVMENIPGKVRQRGELGLTILTIHKPVKLLSLRSYHFEQVDSWKYRTAIVGIPITIILLRELQRIKGGDAAAWLQVLEPNPERRPAIWASILEQDLTGRDKLKSVMMKIDEEAFMTVAEEFRVEGRVEGKAEGLVEGQEKRNLEIARSLIQQGVARSVILKATGLSHAQLDRIESQMD